MFITLSLTNRDTFLFFFLGGASSAKHRILSLVGGAKSHLLAEKPESIVYGNPSKPKVSLL